jgi:hypothetical protein
MWGLIVSLLGVLAVIGAWVIDQLKGK